RPRAWDRARRMARAPPARALPAGVRVRLRSRSREVVMEQRRALIAALLCLAVLVVYQEAIRHFYPQPVAPATTEATGAAPASTPGTAAPPPTDVGGTEARSPLAPRSRSRPISTPRRSAPSADD